MYRNKNINDYEIIKILGKGNFGSVYKAIRKSDDKLIALKEIDMRDQQMIKSATDEIFALSKLSDPVCNPFVICYYGSYYDNVNNKMYIEMEYVDGVDMYAFMFERDEPLPLTQIYRYLILIARDVAKGLDYMHSRGFIHNDVKMENIMIDKENIPKIIDVGLSCLMKTYEETRYCKGGGGTPRYVSPEFITTQERTPASDMWSLGVTLYTAATAKYPFEGVGVQNLMRNIIEFEVPLLNTPNKMLNDIVNGLLVKDPDERLTAKEVYTSVDRYLEQENKSRKKSETEGFSINKMLNSIARWFEF